MRCVRLPGGRIARSQQLHTPLVGQVHSIVRHDGTLDLAPGSGAADRTELCRAAHGVTSPAVTALCHETYCDLAL